MEEGRDTCPATASRKRLGTREFRIFRSDDYYTAEREYFANSNAFDLLVLIARRVLLARLFDTICASYSLRYNHYYACRGRCVIDIKYLTCDSRNACRSLVRLRCRLCGT